jgi:hypothetical protein
MKTIEDLEREMKLFKMSCKQSFDDKINRYKETSTYDAYTKEVVIVKKRK